jgi:hypothetical protein
MRAPRRGNQASRPSDDRAVTNPIVPARPEDCPPTASTHATPPDGAIARRETRSRARRSGDRTRCRSPRRHTTAHGRQGSGQAPEPRTRTCRDWRPVDRGQQQAGATRPSGSGHEAGCEAVGIAGWALLGASAGRRGARNRGRPWRPHRSWPAERARWRPSAGPGRWRPRSCRRSAAAQSTVPPAPWPGSDPLACAMTKRPRRRHARSAVAVVRCAIERGPGAAVWASARSRERVSARSCSMHPILCDAAGHRRPPVTLPGHHAWWPAARHGRRSPADPPTAEETIAVVRTAATGSSAATVA